MAPSAHCRLPPRYAASQRWCHLEVDKGSIAAFESHPLFSLANALPPFHRPCGRHLAAMARRKHICRGDAKVRNSLLPRTTLRPHRARLLTRTMLVSLQVLLLGSRKGPDGYVDERTSTVARPHANPGHIQSSRTSRDQFEYHPARESEHDQIHAQSGPERGTSPHPDPLERRCTLHQQIFRSVI